MQHKACRWLVLIGVFFLGALCGLTILPMIMQHSLAREHERHVALTADIHTLRAELERYKTANGRYPTTEEGLRVLSSRPKDPWGRDYIYRAPGIPHGDPYDVFSAGPDGRPNTTDDDWGD